MEYCLGDPDGSATMWTREPDVDLDGDGVFDGIGLDLDGDGRVDDVMADLDGDGLVEHAVRDIDDDGTAESYFTDDGSGVWAVSVDRSGQVRWFGLDGVEQTGGPTVDFDRDGATDDRLLDTDGDGLADRVLAGEFAHVDTDGDGRWDLKLADTDGDGRADSVS
ncbi:pullulanase [Mycolicibacterium wolinskyi]|uniref:Pullulanase n=1 Tax=Mycolicibacterium wolinskyi TaxID=59750 RepID=A0A1X2FFK4_9MYCO|nr:MULTISPECIES: pullulanase [Mycolicibacterium]MCV7290804.1 pullulanase [Mycolicibacterium wolinskyi]MCV7291143.1 pullulanase [Mycolicibacterium goodii]ORX17222.1 pullulanase [Mycolicibacterium wolinskyi]